jgi:MFS family permease
MTDDSPTVAGVGGGKRRESVMGPLGLAVSLSLYGDLTLYAALATERDAAGLTLGMVGVMLSINRLVRIPANPLGGILYDRRGRRGMFILGMSLGVLTTAAYGLVRGFWPFLMARVAWGIAWTLINVGGLSMVMDVSTAATRGRLMGIYTTWLRIGFALGPLAGGFLVDIVGFRRAMLIGAGVTTLGLGVSALCLPETAPPARPREMAPTGTSRTWRWRLRVLGWPGEAVPAGRGLLVAALLYLIVLFAGEGVAMSTMGLLLTERFGERINLGSMTLGVSAAAGLALAGRAALVGLTGPLAGTLSDRYLGRRAVIAGGLAVGILGFAWLFFARTPAGIVAGIALGAVGVGAGLAALPAWAGDGTRAGRQAAVMGLFATAGDIGSMAGPVLAFGLLAAVDLRWVYLICAAVLLAGLALLWQTEKEAN